MNADIRGWTRMTAGGNTGESGPLADCTALRVDYIGLRPLTMRLRPTA